MKYSKLKHDLEIMKLNHKHELELTKMRHEQKEKQLISTCTHKWEDGTSAKGFRGDQRDSWYVCDICERSM